MGNKDEKTNVMRVLEQKKISYESRSYDENILVASDVAKAVGEMPESVFKTLVTRGKSGAYYVFMVPSEAELDLKAAASFAGEKSIEMIPQKELLPLTGYIHGGCSPIGMKKAFPTFIDESAEAFEKICFSGGKRGKQVKLRTADLHAAIRVRACKIAKYDQ